MLKLLSLVILDDVLYETGRIDIQINVDIPVDTELLEPLQGGCIWRQARGACTVISGADDEAASLEKVATFFC